MLNVKYVVVTGVAGFIGYHVAKTLLSEGVNVIGVDNINDYYDVSLKKSRLRDISDSNFDADFIFYEVDIAHKSALFDTVKNRDIDVIIHLAAQAGVRYSIENPQAYIDSNITGFLNVMQMSVEKHVNHLIYASSSSVYGNTSVSPFSEDQVVDKPVSIYAATKKSNELMANVFTHQFGLNTTGLRFFTVYGPWGRPDMAPFKFVQRILSDQTIDVYNHGDHIRDFTYIDDIVAGVIGLYKKGPDENEKHRIFNIGAKDPVHLLSFIESIERSLGLTLNGLEAKKNMLPMQMGDVRETFADVSKLVDEIGYQPKTFVDEGVDKFVGWYKCYYADSI